MSNWSEAMTVKVPEGERGPWKVERFTISNEASAWSAFSYRERAPEAGTYTRLTRHGSVIMSDTPSERRDHIAPVVEARRRGGRVLIHGLGLGMVLGAVLGCENITAVDVVELDADVIALVGPHYASDKRVTIHQGNALTHAFPKGERWSVAWHDIWDNLCGDNLPDMKTLHRRYGRRVDWQGSWGRDYIEYRMGRY